MYLCSVCYFVFFSICLFVYLVFLVCVFMFVVLSYFIIFCFDILVYLILFCFVLFHFVSFYLVYFFIYFILFHYFLSLFNRCLYAVSSNDSGCNVKLKRTVTSDSLKKCCSYCCYYHGNKNEA